VFYKYPDVPLTALAVDRAERIEAIAQGLPRAEIETIVRRMVSLRLPTLEAPVDGDVAQSGFTVYLGGFDWVTFPTPPHLLQKFPEFLPLPQQVFQTGDEDEY